MGDAKLRFDKTACIAADNAAPDVVTACAAGGLPDDQAACSAKHADCTFKTNVVTATSQYVGPSKICVHFDDVIKSCKEIQLTQSSETD